MPNVDRVRERGLVPRSFTPLGKNPHANACGSPVLLGSLLRWARTRMLTHAARRR